MLRRNFGICLLLISVLSACSGRPQVSIQISVDPDNNYSEESTTWLPYQVEVKGVDRSDVTYSTPVVIVDGQNSGNQYVPLEPNGNANQFATMFPMTLSICESRSVPLNFGLDYSYRLITQRYATLTEEILVEQPENTPDDFILEGRGWAIEPQFFDSDNQQTMRVIGSDYPIGAKGEGPPLLFDSSDYNPNITYWGDFPIRVTAFRIEQDPSSDFTIGETFHYWVDYTNYDPADTLNYGTSMLPFSKYEEITLPITLECGEGISIVQTCSSYSFARITMVYIHTPTNRLSTFTFSVSCVEGGA